MSKPSRKALSSQKYRSHSHRPRQRKQTTIEEQLPEKDIGQISGEQCKSRDKKTSELTKLEEWGDDSLYDDLDIDSLIAHSQQCQNYQTTHTDKGSQSGDGKTSKSLNRDPTITSGIPLVNDVILSGSPELFDTSSNDSHASVVLIKAQQDDAKRFDIITHDAPHQFQAHQNCDDKDWYQKKEDRDKKKVGRDVKTGMMSSQIFASETSASLTGINSGEENNFCGDKQEREVILESEIWFEEKNLKRKLPQDFSCSNVNSKSNFIQSDHKERLDSLPELTTELESLRNSSSDIHRKELNGIQPAETVAASSPCLSLGSRFKQKLQKNVNAITPTSSREIRAIRKANVDQAIQEMAKVEMDCGDNKDIGPFYGLPTRVQELLTLHRGITKLYDWQHTCLSLTSVQSGKNLIYSLPTSGGKTLVAEILIFQQLLCHRKDAMLILPYVSIVQEKVSSLSVLAVELGFLVEEYAGTKGAIPPRRRRKKNTLFVCTIEKAHSLINSLITEKRIDSVGLVVVDELHMLGDGSRRGASLEATLSKLRYLGMSQIIGMSATLSDIEDLCHFLDAEVYTSQFRPVELTEFIKIGDALYEVNTKALCPDDRFTHSRNVVFPYNNAMQKNDPDHLIGLALEVIPYNSCLIFCATKKNCQSVAQLICKYMPRNVSKKILAHNTKEKEELLLSLRRECDDHLCSTLKKTVPYGIAYHHSGLTMDERKLIEEAYNQGTLCLLACTSTLAAGVNLPAKRVVLRSPYIAKDLLTRSRYKQMVGRAGRAGLDSSGESILIVQERDRRQVADMLNSPLEGCHSSLLHDDGKGLRSLILSLIALELTSSREDVHRFMSNTLLGVQAVTSQVDYVSQTEGALQQLIEQHLIKENKSDESQQLLLKVTNIGKAAFKGAIDIDQCNQLYQDLQEVCAQGMVLANNLHLLFLVTPYDQIQSITPDWFIFDRQFSTLGEAEMKVAELIGITEHYVKNKVTGVSSRKFTDHSEQRANRFYLALMLWNILNRKSIWQVAERFEVSRGFVQSLFTSAASFASSIQRFCEDLPQFWAIHQLLGKVTYDLSYCATADLLPLLEVSGVKQGRARQLVNAGYKTLRHLAFANPETLVRDIEHLPKRVAKEIISAAKLELAERAEALKEEAEEMMMSPSPLRH
ncbi:Helicase POLQ-like [Holothuria leucospilota]|uniref:Helicase POLQ-like n=1 Tax=Holothuria leucospilota TaxID=206669 RepID=A0A9Q1BF39_HOLLE|nr:Helicase POLQ-like [Holothuria leucospilota]